MISHKHKFIFVHIPKTAGTSISFALKKYCDDEWKIKKNIGFIQANSGEEQLDLKNTELGLRAHATLQNYYDKLGDKIHDYYTFTCVRSPWARIVSQAAFQFDNTDVNGLKKFYKCVLKQSDFVQIDGKVAIDYCMKFDNLQADFDKVCEDIGLPKIKLPHKNKSKQQPNYRSCFDDELKKLVNERFQEEIKLFNFKF